MIACLLACLRIISGESYCPWMSVDMVIRSQTKPNQTMPCHAVPSLPRDDHPQRGGRQTGPRGGGGDRSTRPERGGAGREEEGLGAIIKYTFLYRLRC